MTTYLSELRKLNPQFQQFDDETLIDALPRLDPQRFAGLKPDQVKTIATETTQEYELRMYEEQGGGFLSSLEKGARRVNQSFNAAGAALGDAVMSATPESFQQSDLGQWLQGQVDTDKQDILRDQKAIEAIPTRPELNRAINAANKEDSVLSGAGSFLGELWQSPDKLGLFVDLTAEQLPNLAIMAGTAAATGGLGSGLAANSLRMGGSTALASGATTLGSNTAEAMDGDLSKFGEAFNKAALQSGVQAAIDGAVGAMVPIKIGGRQLINMPAQSLLQVAGGSTGAYAAAKAGGDDITQGEILAEGLLELLTMPADVATAAMDARRGNSANAQAEKLSQEQLQEEESTKQRAVDYLDNAISDARSRLDSLSEDAPTPIRQKAEAKLERYLMRKAQVLGEVVAPNTMDDGQSETVTLMNGQVIPRSALGQLGGVQAKPNAMTFDEFVAKNNEELNQIEDPLERESAKTQSLSDEVARLRQRQAERRTAQPSMTGFADGVVPSAQDDLGTQVAYARYQAQRGLLNRAMNQPLGLPQSTPEQLAEFERYQQQQERNRSAFEGQHGTARNTAREGELLSNGQETNYSWANRLGRYGEVIDGETWQDQLQIGQPVQPPQQGRLFGPRGLGLPAAEVMSNQPERTAANPDAVSYNQVDGSEAFNDAPSLRRTAISREVERARRSKTQTRFSTPQQSVIAEPYQPTEKELAAREASRQAMEEPYSGPSQSRKGRAQRIKESSDSIEEFSVPISEENLNSNVAVNNSDDGNNSAENLATQAEASFIENEAVASTERVVATENVVDAQQGKQPLAEPAARIDDVGEVIAGAKKDQWQRYRDTISDEVDVASEPLSKSFPQPDYEKLAAEGESKRALALVAILRNQIPAKPKRAGRLNTWVKTVNAVRDVASLVMENPDRVDSALNAAIRARVLTSESKVLLDMMEQLPPSKIKEAATYQIGSGTYTIYNGERFNPPKVVYSIASKHRIPELTRKGFDNAHDAAIALKTYLSETDSTSKQSKSAAKLDVYRDRYTGEAFIGWKSSAGVLRVEVFGDTKQARQAIVERRDELESKLADMKRIPSMRETVNLTRVGPERRTGNVDAEEFRETFGFRGVQFGNYVEQGKRQKDLNEAYDGLMDLAELLHIPPRAISLNGKLGLAFGARGQGKYKAHYEPGQVVINLTKNSGSGSLAHEWWHALDNYFGGANANGDHEFLTGRGSRSRAVTGNLRQEVADAFSSIIKTIEATDLRDRSKQLDNLRTKPYWSTNVEMSARAFEAYVKSRLSEQNYSNDYLANIRSEEAWSNLSSTASYPYPTDAEIAGITAAYDDLFSTLQYRETDDGIALFSLAENQEKGMKAEDVAKSLESLINDLNEKQTFNVVQSIDDLPFALRLQAKARLRKSNAENPVLRGINAGDKNYLIADGLRNEKEAIEIFLHEVVGHKAVLDMLGKEGDAIMERIAMSYGRKGLADLIDTYGVDYATKDGRILLGKEKVAHMSERSEKPTLLKQLVAKVKSWLRNYFPSIKWSDNDVLSLISQARQKVEQRHFVKVDLDADTEQTTQNDSVHLSIVDSVKRKLDERLKPKAEETEFDKFYKSLGDKDRSLAERSKQFMRRQFAAGGLLPDNVFKEKIARDGDMNAHELEISARLQSFRKAVKKAYNKEYDALTPAQKAELNRELTSTETNKRIPLNVRASIVELRSVINGLSKEYASVLEQDIKELEAKGNTADAAEKIALLQTIRSNMDTYAHRSYRAFDDPDWPKKVPKDVVKRAEEYVKVRYSNQGLSEKDASRKALQTIKTILEEGTAYQSMSSFIKESKLGAKDLSTLKRRKDIAPEIMALLGVYEDVEINFAKTVTKMGRLVANHLFLKRVLEIGKQEGFLFDEDNKPLNRSVVRIAAEGSEVLAPLNGLYTYPEIEQAFREALSKGGSQEGWVDAMIRFNGMVKYGKTVISPTTAMRNIWSAFFFTMANGHFDMSHLKKSLSMSTQYFGGDYDKAKLEYLKKLQRLGVVHDNPHAGEMMDLLKDSQLEETLFSKKPFSSLKKLTDFAQTFYQYGDDMWKIVGFENEKALLMKHKGMSEKEAEIAAAERIRNTYPTYSMVGKFPQWLRRFPLAGTFVSFPSEILRTSFHMLNYLRQDFKDSPEYAMRKVAGLILVSSLAFAAQGISKAMMGLDDDEEEAVRDMAPEWSKNSNMLFLGRDEKGNIQYLDLSFLDPYNYFKRPINAMLRDQPIKDMATQSAVEMTAPFFGQDITFGTMLEVYNNKKDSGGKVYNEQDTVTNQTGDIINHLRKGLQPGFMNNIERTFKAMEGDVSASGKEYRVEDEIAALFGFRASTVDPKTALYYQSFDFKQRKSDATKVLKDVMKDPNGSTVEELQDARDIMLRSREQAYEQMTRLVSSAKNAGMTNQEIMKVLKLSGVSKKDIMALLYGRKPEEDDFTEMADTIAERSAVLYGNDLASDIRQRASNL